jgi:hypothetical protein
MRSACLFVAFMVFAGCGPAPVRNVAPEPAKTLPDGVYAVLRESLSRDDVLPLKDGESLLAHRSNYLKNDGNQPPRFLVVRSVPDVKLDLAGEPNAVKEGTKVVRILLKLEPEAAGALERLTSEHVGGQIAIVIGGDVVTVHKIRDVIKGGEVQITNCAAGAADHLLEKLLAHQATNEKRGGNHGH